MSKVQTDHSYFEEKVKLRLDGLPDKNPLKVLDMFSGNGLIWSEIEKRTGREILVLRIDRKRGKRGAYLVGDNRKFNFDFSEFDVVDLDGYGVPFSQLEKIFASEKKPRVVFLTFIQSEWGTLPRKMLNHLGYTDSMIKKIPTLFNRRGQGKFLQYLALRGVPKVQISYTQDKRKNYISV
jgi:hypothetical protein